MKLLPIEDAMGNLPITSEQRTKLADIIRFLFTWQEHIAKVFTELPTPIQYRLARRPFPSLARGPMQVCACKDGVLALVLNGFFWEQKIDLRIMLSRLMQDALNAVAGYTYTYVNPITKFTSRGHSVAYNGLTVSSGSMFTMVLSNSGSDTTIPVYSKFHLIGWDYLSMAKETPVDFAVRDVQTAYAELNLGSKSKGDQLVMDFCALLEDADPEEELQRFLADNPVLLCPEYESCKSKPNLGGERQPDFAVSRRAYGGVQWIFVEIERPSKPFFTRGKEFQFHSEFTQAKGQLLQWDRLISQDHAFFERRFRGLYKPEFILVYGRNQELDAERRAMLQTEFAATNNRRCITYDDLAETFDRRLKKIGEFGQKGDEEPVSEDIEESNKPLAPDHYSAPAL